MLVVPGRDLTSGQNCLTLVWNKSMTVPAHRNEVFRKARDGTLSCLCVQLVLDLNKCI